MCSWSTEPESLCNNWRGWKRPCIQSTSFQSSRRYVEDVSLVPSLTELTARCVASHIPFELVEHVYPPVPEQLQLRIAFWSFPDNEEDIRLYSCLANGSSDEFQRGENLFRNRAVRDPLQIGFHLSATVESIIDANRHSLNVAVTFDRRRITSCNCTCTSTAYWCSHVVAVCLHRINKSDTVTLRAPVSESLSRLRRDQLQKFAQYLISELPQQILPTAQRLLDELLSSQPSAINSVCGAPDPTAGASITDQTSWYLDEKTLHENIQKIVIKFCVPAPIVFSDVNYLATSAPPAASEWTSLLRPLRGREPEGMWNLLSIVREMYKRNDRNAVPLLSIITDECLNCEQILVWWYNTCVALHSGNHGGRHAAANSNTHASQHACASLCEEIVVLWRLAALNPGISPDERDLLQKKFNDWHAKIMDRVSKSRGTTMANANAYNRFSPVEVFFAFTPAIQACHMDWEDYPLPGITYTSGSSPVYHNTFTCFRHTNETGHQVNSSEAVLNLSSHYGHHPHHPRRVGNVMELFPRRRDCMEHKPSTSRDGNRSSISSEGFCENDGEDAAAQAINQYETDSQEGGGSDSVSSSDAGLSRQPSHKGPSKERRSLSSESAKRLRGFAMKDQSSEESDTGVFAPGPSNIPKPQPVDSPASSEGWNTSPHRAFNESATSNSDDEYRKVIDAADNPPDKDDEQAREKPREDPWNILFARAEGLHAHGHGREASTLAVKLALQLLENPPNLMVEIPVIHSKGKRKKINPISHQMSCLASATLAKCAFLCAVLTEAHEHHHLAFRVGLFGLEMARPPASTKPLEVKLANQESELVVLVKKIPLGHDQLRIVRDKAQQLWDGTLRTRGEALLPIMLASFIFDALEGTSSIREMKLPTDERLAFEAAVAALGLKANVSEADHPLLCEGTRRQRGELAITLLVHYKDEPSKLARIMEKLLDREVHNLLKSPLTNWYTSSPQSRYNPPPNRIDEIEMKPPAILQPIAVDPMQMDMGSRPHSGTSAELDQAVGSLNISTPAAPAPMPRGKESSRYKGKRVYPSIPNQPSEASAHFMIELAKTVLNKAGGNSSTSLFTQASTSQHHHCPHRALHICAFQIGLYALGLHNCVSPNWLSRTYSSHVSWITGQAMEIGATAISFLIDTWEGHLTPPEAASIADRASRGCDPNMVRAAAELALSVLPHAHALNPNEITRAIVQCKEQSEAMLEHSCLTVENAAKGGGVYPEVLFQVAKYWYDLYLRQSGGIEAPLEPEIIPDPLSIHFSMDNHGGLLLVEQPPPPPPPQDMPSGSVVMASPPLLPVSYVAPYSFTLHPTFRQVYLTQPPFQIAPPHQYFLQPNPFPVGAMQPMGQNPNPIQMIPPPPNVAVAGVSVMPPPNQMPSMPTNMPPPGGLMPPPAGVVPSSAPVVPVQIAVTQAVAGRAVHQASIHRANQSQYSPAQVRCLMSSYRVGMLALETLARRVHDDRPQAKYARTPPYGEDVKWLLRVAKKLASLSGTQYLHQFCYCVVNSIVSPFILYEVALESAHFLARNNPQLVLTHLRSALAPLVSKCQQMFIQCLHQKLYHLNAADYEDFVNVVCSARSAFNITPDGTQQFKEWLQSIRRSKSCKKDLWAQINAALQTNSK